MVTPAFVDNHCHILPAGLQLLQLDLSETHSHEEVIQLLKERHETQPEGWLLAVHYDQNRYGGEHLHRAQLDAIASERPILLRHSSGHAGVANTSALRSARIGDDQADEQGGSYVRDSVGSLTGVLLENALERVSNALPKPSREMMATAILAAAESMANYGIVSASDMQTGVINLEDELWAYREAARSGCPIAMRLYIQWGRVFGRRGVGEEGIQQLAKGFEGTECRIQGIKLFADGAIGAGTAAIYGSYADSMTGESTSGILMYKPEELRSRILRAAGAGWQVSVHAIGDYASDLVMDAFEGTEQPSKHRIEHAMLLSDAQIERLKRIDCFVSVQPEFLSRFGGTYQAKLGPERSFDLIRFRSLDEAGIKLSFSSDRPITQGDPRLGMALAMNRPRGFSERENLKEERALHAYTIAGATATGD